MKMLPNKQKTKTHNREWETRAPISVCESSMLTFKKLNVLHSLNKHENMSSSILNSSKKIWGVERTGLLLCALAGTQVHCPTVQGLGGEIFSKLFSIHMKNTWMLVQPGKCLCHKTDDVAKQLFMSVFKKKRVIPDRLSISTEEELSHHTAICGEADTADEILQLAVCVLRLDQSSLDV